jgi:hypothetical protein
MATLRHVASLASLALITGCYRQEPDLYSTFPEATEVDGPPGGEIDRAWQEGYVDDNAATTATAYVDASVGPPATGELVGSCTDGEISATLDPHGEWVWIEGYGYVWRPYPTVVGVDFTPYETCGTWVWTEWGWTFACEWDWGWLPFHYGRWGWFDDYWPGCPVTNGVPRGSSGAVAAITSAGDRSHRRCEIIGPATQVRSFAIIAPASAAAARSSAIIAATIRASTAA